MTIIPKLSREKAVAVALSEDGRQPWWWSSFVVSLLAEELFWYTQFVGILGPFYVAKMMSQTA